MEFRVCDPRSPDFDPTSPDYSVVGELRARGFRIRDDAQYVHLGEVQDEMLSAGFRMNLLCGHPGCRVALDKLGPQPGPWPYVRSLWTSGLQAEDRRATKGNAHARRTGRGYGPEVDDGRPWFEYRYDCRCGGPPHVRRVEELTVVSIRAFRKGWRYVRSRPGERLQPVPRR